MINSIKQTLDDIDLLMQCQKAVADLIAPAEELQEIQLDRVATLMDFLNREHAQLIDQLRRAL